MLEQAPSAVDAPDVEREKERIFRQLRRDAAEEEAREKTKIATTAGGEVVSQGDKAPATDGAFSGSVYAAKPTILGMKSAVMYTHTDLFRNVAFGGTIGSITGMVFGFMDGMKSAQDSAMLKNASNAAKFKYLLQGTTRSGMLFGGFFGGYHAIKYGVRCLADPGDVGEVAVASVVSMAAMTVKPATRPSIPYAGMLIAMDTFNIYMRDNTA
jgi:hypothetical protein